MSKLKNLRNYKTLASEIPISEFIPYSHHITDTIISTKNAEYLSVWKIGGRSHQSASQQEVFTWVSELNNLLRGIAGSGISIWSHVVRKKVFEYPQGKFNNSFCRKLDEKYKESFSNYNLMVNELYLTVIIRPNSNQIFSFFSKHEKENYEQKKQYQAEAIKELEDINRMIGATLSRYNADVLGIYENNGYSYSSALEFLSLLINGKEQQVPVCRARFSDYLAFSRPIFSNWGEIGELRATNDSRLFGILEITDYDAKTEPGQLNILLEAGYEFILTQSFSMLSQHAAKGFLQKHKQQLIDAKDVAYLQISEIDEALNQLVSRQFVMGEHHASVTVFGKTAEEVRKHLAGANADLLDVGIISKSCDLALEAAYFAQLPGNWSYRPRPKPITSLNFLCFSPFHNFMSGKPTDNPWGEAVTILKTISGTPLYFNFHASPLKQDSYGQRLLGNTMIIGKSGTGKTVTLGFLLAQSQKYKPTIVTFDKDRGMEIAVRAMGGCYLPLKKGIPSGFNPFQLEPTPANLSFLKDLIKKLASNGGAELITHADEVEIEDALNTLMLHIDKPLRRLSMLLQGLPNPMHEESDARPTVHARLLKWREGGELGWLFDNEADSLNLATHRIYGFDVTEFLEDPEIRVPTIMYLVHASESMIDGRRFMYVFDEFWKMLEDEYFEDLAKNKQKTIRKENGIFIFSTQEPSDALDSKIAKTLVQQCATYIFLPNPGADYKDYVEGFKLSEVEFDLITSLAEDSHRFLIKQGDSCAIAELNLSDGFDEELLVLSGTPDNAQIAENIIKEINDDNSDIWLPLFFKKVKEQRGRA